MSSTRVALVSGASRGLGAVIARRLAAGGWTVAVNYRSGAEHAARVVDDIRRAGGAATSYAADVTDEAAVAELVGRAGAELGPVLAVVANATGPQPVVGLEELTWQGYLDQFRFFVKSPTLLTQAALPAMKEHRFGRVILIGSDMVDRAKPGWSAYAAAKAAEAELVKIWARELGPHRITVNLVAPGWIPVERHAGPTRRPTAPTSRSDGWAPPTTSPAWSATWPRTPPASSPPSGSASTAGTPSPERYGSPSGSRNRPRAVRDGSSGQSSPR